MYIRPNSEKGFFENSNSGSLPSAIKSLGRAVRTVIITPPHTETINVSMKALKLAKPLPMQPPIPEVVETLAQAVLPNITKDAPPLTPTRLMYLGSALIQFTDHVPTLYDTIRTSYRHIENLYDAVIEKASTGAPLTFAEQLQTSLELNNGSLPNSLWQLFLASRFYARRRDNEALEGSPTCSAREKLESMMAWQHSLAACVPYSEEGYQDAAGDTYYCWTHALAKVAFKSLPAQPNAMTNLAGMAFDNGTEIMQGVVNRLYPEGGGATARNHGMAAAYGNAIGEVCVQALATQKPLPW